MSLVTSMTFLPRMALVHFVILVFLRRVHGMAAVLVMVHGGVIIVPIVRAIPGSSMLIFMYRPSKVTIGTGLSAVAQPGLHEVDLVRLRRRGCGLQGAARPDLAAIFRGQSRHNQRLGVVRNHHKP